MGSVRPQQYFSEDQRWPTPSQRFGWLVVLGISLFVAFQLNLHLTAPLVAVPVMLLLLLLVLTVITLQQRLTVRIGLEADSEPDAPVAQRFWRKAVRVVPLAPTPVAHTSTVVLRIDYRVKSPLSALSPSRRGARLGGNQQRLTLSEIDNWSAGHMPLLAALRRNTSTFPVGLQRDAVMLVLVDGRKLTLPTRMQAELLQALSEAKVDSLRRQQPVKPVVREEL